MRRGTRRRNVRELLGLVGPYRSRSIVTLLALLLGTAASLAPPLLAKEAIDQGIAKHSVGTLVLVVVAFLVSALLVWVMTHAQTYLVGWIGQRALADLRIRIFSHLQSLPVGFYESRPTGVLISRMTNDVEALDTLVTDSVVTLFQSGLTLVGTIGILLYLDVKLALLTFVALLPMAALSVWFRIVSTGAFRRTRETIGSLTAYLQETLSGMRVVRSFGQEPRHEARFATLNGENREANMVTVRLNAAYFPAVELLSGLAVAAIVLYGGYQAIDGHITVGTIVAFVAALANLFEPVQQLSQLYTTYQSGMAALEKIFTLLDEQPELRDRPGAIALPRIRGEVRFEDVSFAYGPPRAGPGVEAGAAADAGGDVGALEAHERVPAAQDGPGELAEREPARAWALRDVTLHVPPGQTVALVGATGAGKSTIAKLLARFYDPTHGRVLVDGFDLREVTSASLRSQLGIVPQEAFLFSGTIAENIAFGNPRAGDAEVHEAARAVGAHELIEAMERGYDTEIGERGVKLSSGQRQLIAFARAIIADPRILILDEATSSVDLRTERRIQEGMRRLLAGRTAVVIAHRLSTIRSAAQIVVLRHGRVVERGAHDQLAAAGGLYAQMYADWSSEAA
jgi:ABC-type multidrug transport system fused ATPase/permease subunit